VRPRAPRTLACGLAGLALAAAAAGATGCSSTKNAAPVPGAATVTITLTNDGCAPDPATVPAGPVTFKVRNQGGDQVSEAELKRGETIIGEKENLTPGLSGSFSLHVDAGTYTIACPDAKTETFPFTVTGATSTGAAFSPAVTAKLNAAVKEYQLFVIGEVDKLVPATKAFTDAVRAGEKTGNLAKAQTLYAPARYFYEEVEPVAESFGDLDPDVDARIDNVDNPSQWTGFHRIEKALWADKSLHLMTPIADKLDADVAKLKTLVATNTYQPAELANGATELLNEVASTKITGEEDRYSHTDLSDFDANIVGAKKAFELLAPALQALDPALAATVAGRFTDILAALDAYHGSYAGSRFVDYSTVNGDARRALTQKVDALAEPLSQVAAKVTS
jgi:iron uptake system component EfeO